MMRLTEAFLLLLPERNGKNDVRLFSAPLDKITLVDGGFYKPCSLQGEKTTDEDGHSNTIFTDKLGRKVLERRNDGKNNNDTYFVYNDLGQLRYVPYNAYA